MLEDSLTQMEKYLHEQAESVLPLQHWYSSAAFVHVRQVPGEEQQEGEPAHYSARMFRSAHELNLVQRRNLRTNYYGRHNAAGMNALTAQAFRKALREPDSFCDDDDAGGSSDDEWPDDSDDGGRDKISTERAATTVGIGLVPLCAQTRLR